MARVIRLVALMSALILLLTGCVSRQVSESGQVVALPEPPAEEENMILGERLPSRLTNVSLYYATSDGASFSTVTTGIRATARQALLEAAVDAVLNPAAGEQMYFSTGDTRLLGCEYACGIATVNLSIDARNVQSEQELLSLVTAVGNTLVGINGVRGVNVLIGGQSESFARLPLGVQTAVIPSVTASYAQLLAEHDHLLTESAIPVTRSAALYFPTSGGSWLVPELRQIVFNSDDFAGTLIEALKSGPLDESCAVSSIPAGVELLDANPKVQTLSTGEHALTLNFSPTLANYLAFSGLEVWELAGSIALTVCSFLPEIDAVRILVDGDPITICEMGDTVLTFEDGLIRRSDFSSRIGSVASLYLADERGALQSVKRAVSTRSALSPRSLLIELFGCTAPNLSPRFPVPGDIYPEDLLGVEVSGRTARVNLSAGFYRACQPLDAVGERSVVYAMVNTLCQLDSISAVRFYVEGMAAETLAGGIYLKSALMPNPGLVTAPEVTGEP